MPVFIIGGNDKLPKEVDLNGALGLGGWASGGLKKQQSPGHGSIEPWIA